MVEESGFIYLDHAATTPVDPEVAAVLDEYNREWYGNAASMYELGVKSERTLESARKTVSAVLGCKPEEIYFTSGGTESDNWAVKGIAFANEKKGKHIITTAIEHHAVLEPCRFMEQRGWEVTYVPVDAMGMVDPEDVRKAIRPGTVLISVMHANNEVGTIEPVEEIGRIAKEHGVPFHTDAVQTVGKIPVDVNRIGCDALSISAHKFHGPKGVGVMYLRRGTRIEPLMHGGGQESNKRAGTHNVPAVAGLARAIELSARDLDRVGKQTRKLADRLKQGLLERIPDIRYNGHPTQRIPGNVHVCVEGIEGEAMLLCLDTNKICCSSGSACTTGSLDPSHVLLAMGMAAEVAHGSLRFTLGKENTTEEIDMVLEVFPGIVEKLRAMSPIYHKH